MKENGKIKYTFMNLKRICNCSKNKVLALIKKYIKQAFPGQLTMTVKDYEILYYLDWTWVEALISSDIYF